MTNKNSLKKHSFQKTSYQKNISTIMLFYNCIIISVLLGFFEAFAIDKVYMYVPSDTNNLTFFDKFILIFGFPLVVTICLSFVIFLLISVYKATINVSNRKIINTAFGIYYVLCIFTISLYPYSSPISFLTSFIYTKITHNDLSDIINYKKQQYIIKREIKWKKALWKR